MSFNVEGGLNAEGVVTPVTLTITLTGIPDGDYLTRVFREDTGALIVNEEVTFSGGTSVLNVGIAAAIQTTSFIINSNVTPTKFGADNGVTA